MRARAACVRWALGTAAACAGAAAVAVAAPAPALRAVLAAALAGAALAAVWAFRDLRERQRRILRQIETQTRVVHNAARVAAERDADP
ncbi:hypothetical protein ACIBF1_10335 [Spirillospora sp. NPDC050679]